MNTKVACLLVSLLFFWQGFSQENRIDIDGSVQRDSTLLAQVKIINVSSKQETLSFPNGRFNLAVKQGDTLLFSALNHGARLILISETIIKNKFLKVYLEEGFNELDEVMLVDNFRLEFGDMTIPEGAILAKDEFASRKVPDMINVTDPTRQNTNVNFKSLFQSLRKLIWKKKIEEKEANEEASKMKDAFIETIAASYEVFFTRELDIEADKIYQFIEYCQDQGLAELFNSPEIEVMNFLVVQSEKFNAIKPE
jgi:hypothetical protein